MKRTYNAKTIEEVMKQNNEYFEEVCELKRLLK